MNHTQLKAFDAVVREGSFSKAGLRLGLTQPAITIQVKSLERDYGTKLFTRRGRGVTPTRMGEQLFQMTQRIFKIEEQARLFLKNRGDGVKQEKLRIGTDCQSMATGLVTRWLRQHPGTFLSFHQFSAEAGYRELFSGNIDILITATATNDSRLCVKELDTQKLMVLLPKHHHFSSRKTISLQELVNMTNLIYDHGSVVQTIIDQGLQGSDKSLQPIMQIGSSDSVRHAVASGFGVGVVVSSEIADDGRLVALEVTDISQPLSGYVVVLKSVADQDLVKSFLHGAGGIVGGNNGTVVLPIGLGQAGRGQMGWNQDSVPPLNSFQKHLQTGVVK